jgi:hypothetical protein
MTSQPQVPGAPAVYLYREEVTNDDLHVFNIYVRLKVLTERGKEYSNVELPYYSTRDGNGSSFSITVGDIEGRTIHSDGTIIPFTGKPYDKLIEKTKETKHMAKVFSLPDVQVGSIIEYRYSRRLDDNRFLSPQWYVQSDLFTRKAHYLWRPTDKPLISSDDRGQLTNTIAWAPLLPASAQVKQTRLPGTSMHDSQLILELNISDVPPAPEEEYMPPISSLTYRVLFYYSPYRTQDEYWKSEGKHWSKERDKFINPGSGVTAAVRELTLPSDTQDQKLRKLYAAVMKLENSDFTRTHTTAEEKSQGLKEVRNTDDIWAHKRGTSDQLTELFVAMARAAGMKAYLMTVTNRDHSIFIQNYLSLWQLDDYIAIVNVDGAEKFFDPGSRYCPYQHLAWKHTFAGGIRQVDGGSAIATAPGESYTSSRVARVADLKMDEHGIANGTVKLSFTGAPALHWRQLALRGDTTSLDHDLQTQVEHFVPNGMEIKVASIEKLADYEEPLVVNLTAKGPIGSPTGKRLLIPGDIFESNTKPTFPHEKREVAVYFHYPYVAQDAFRVTFPASFHIESVPSTDKAQMKAFAAYNIQSDTTSTSVTVRRNLSLGEILFPPQEYSELRTFYSKMETKDQESIVLTTAPKAGTSGN